jgi:hypothetical protein
LFSGGFVDQPETRKQKVTVSAYLRMGDNAEAFFVGFNLGRAGTEYLILPKNGEPKPKPGTYQVQNRHGINEFELTEESGDWFMEYVPKKENSLLIK